MEYNGLPESQTDSPSSIHANQDNSHPTEDYRPQPTVTHRPAGDVELRDYSQVAERLQQLSESQEADRSDEETDYDTDSSFCLYDMEMGSDEIFSDFDTDIDLEDDSTNDSAMNQDMFQEMETLLAAMKRARNAARQTAATDAAADGVDCPGPEEGAEASPSQHDDPENLSPLDLLAYASVNIAKRV